MDTKGRLALKQELKEKGFDIDDIRNWPAKTTYYKPDGTPLPNLPADVYSVQKYLKKGLLLKPPKRIKKPEVSIIKATRRRRKKSKIKRLVKFFRRLEIGEKLNCLFLRDKAIEIYQKARRYIWTQKPDKL